MLNKKIKPFKSIAYYANKFYEINENKIKNKWNIFFFFPFAYSFICPTELKEISNNIEKFKKLNTDIYGISSDSHFTQKNWINNELKFINFPFISDLNHNISKNNKVLNYCDGNSERATIIINPNLIIKSIDIIDSSISRSIDDLIFRLNMLIFTHKNKNHLCPYSWNYNNKSIII
ncbi:redoxin domain-containing protein [Candidatus Carsonella ruddii]|uniref:Alkyl hydroperoxide reductase C n=1 Tax=Carsonella ruddii TaxID=114186 RepID=A0AAE7KLE9_CARRU|nr:redoxin domain-containing protein [Candidatus Carsonella ruddii]AGS06624.1 alkyl hydroperoxide reductase [Candidatus Carsonella ruddii DC]ALA96866.1 hypothetical protein AMC76_00740 [Candidatus Carsonella ruddii]QLK14099.1 redoxin domain-containing protein [Candidatus Carsonella ruddii]